jgi:hypothetical protein
MLSDVLERLTRSYTGQLPFLTHLNRSISPLLSIVSYLSSLDPATVPQLDEGSPPPNPSLDVHLDHMQRQKTVAWRAYAEAHLGDLVVRIQDTPRRTRIIHDHCNRRTHFTRWTQTITHSLVQRSHRYYQSLNSITSLGDYARCIGRVWKLQDYGRLG